MNEFSVLGYYQDRWNDLGGRFTSTEEAEKFIRSYKSSPCFSYFVIAQNGVHMALYEDNGWRIPVDIRGNQENISLANDSSLSVMLKLHDQFASNYKYDVTVYINKYQIIIHHPLEPSVGAEIGIGYGDLKVRYPEHGGIIQTRTEILIDNYESAVEKERSKHEE